jgi:hypothetical protein
LIDVDRPNRALCDHDDHDLRNLKFVNTLRQAGVPEAQVQSEAELATKSDLREMKTEIMGELRLNRWMLGQLLAGTMSLILKNFF